jgi:hypothetical protein
LLVPSENETLPPVYQPGTRLELGQESGRPYLGPGWYDADQDYPHLRWSAANAEIKFRLEQVQPLQRKVMAATFQPQRVIVSLNGKAIGTVYHGGGPLRLFELTIPPGTHQQQNTIAFELPEARSPKSIGGDDDRVLGVRVAWIKLAP